MPNSQSHLFSLAHLLETAQKRRSETPPPVVPPSNSADSGLIDFLAIQSGAREKRDQAAAVSTPVAVTFARSHSDPGARSLSHSSGLDLLQEEDLRRQKRFRLGAIVGSMAMLTGVLLTVAFTGGSPPPPPVAAAEAQVLAASVAAPAPPPVVAAAAATPDPTAAPIAAPEPATKGHHKKAKKHASQGKGPKMTKVHSSGT